MLTSDIEKVSDLLEKISPLLAKEGFRVTDITETQKALTVFGFPYIPMELTITIVHSRDKKLSGTNSAEEQTEIATEMIAKHYDILSPREAIEAMMNGKTLANAAGEPHWLSEKNGFVRYKDLSCTEYPITDFCGLRLRNPNQKTKEAENEGI